MRNEHPALGTAILNWNTINVEEIHPYELCHDRHSEFENTFFEEKTPDENFERHRDLNVMKSIFLNFLYTVGTKIQEKIAQCTKIG